MIEMILYVFFIILANVLAANFVVPIGFGLVVPAGAFAVAPIFTLRDSIHRKYGYKRAIYLIIFSSVISYISSIILGNPMLGKVTIASIIAFICSELLDTHVYHLFKQSSWVKRVVISNLFSVSLDSIIFITIAFGFSVSFVLGQFFVKFILSILVMFILKKGKIYG